MAAPKNLVTSGQLTAADLAAALLAQDGEGAAEHEGEGSGDAAAAAAAAAAEAPANSEPHAAKPAKGGKPAAGQVMKKGAAPVSAEHLSAQVIVRITKKGHGAVHNGDGGVYDWNDEVVLPLAVAQGLEAPDRAFGEIVGNA